MTALTEEKLQATLSKIKQILKDEGFPKNSVTIGFNPSSLSPDLGKAQVNKSTRDIPTVAGFSCKFGGCGIICCEWTF